MRDAVAATEQVYDRIAQAYRERWHDSDVLLQDQERFLRQVAAGPLLDAGCGTGRDLAQFARRERCVVGVDRSRRMLQIARDSVPGPVRLVRADVRALPFRRVFQGWWAAASLLHLPREELPRALASLRRVTAVGGVGYLSVKLGSGERAGEDGRHFCFWQPEELDRLIEDASWSIMDAWESPDSVGREPWLARLIRTPD